MPINFPEFKSDEKQFPKFCCAVLPARNWNPTFVPNKRMKATIDRYSSKGLLIANKKLKLGRGYMVIM